MTVADATYYPRESRNVEAALIVLSVVTAVVAVVWYVNETGRGDEPVYHCAREECPNAGVFLSKGRPYCFFHYLSSRAANDN
ncbi:MAG: hypothetical protein AAB439_03590 [Patescibacteria group bacterium]